MSNKNRVIGVLTHISRSGSTLLSRMLDEYEDICITTEAELPLELFGVKSYTPISFPDLSRLEIYIDRVLGRTRFGSWDLSTGSIMEQCRAAGFPISGPRFVNILLNIYCETYKPGARIIFYKANPLMPWHLPQSIKYFPAAPVLHVIRDPRAVYYSQSISINPYTGKPYTTAPMRTAMDWKAAAGVSEMISAEGFIEVRYEDLIHSPERTIGSILKQFGLEDSKKASSSRSFLERMEARDKDLHNNIAQQPDPEKNRAWSNHLSPRDIQIIETFLAREMREKSYELSLEGTGSNLFTQLYIILALFRERIWNAMRRSRRVLGHFIWDPSYLRHRVLLKVKHDG